ncbi:MAG: LamG-like jellyroll fold domain-containing protein [Phycisphaeraceae bacterium JB051]
MHKFSVLLVGCFVTVLSVQAWAATAQKADENTIALWTMDDVEPDPVVVKDGSGHKMDMKVNGEGALKFVDGLFGKAVDGFDPQGNRDNRYLQPTAYKLSNPQTQTFEAWICWPDKKDLPGRVRQTLWRNAGSRTPLHFYFLKDKDGDIELTLLLREAKKTNEAKTEYVTWYLDKTPEPGQWYHVAYTIEPKDQGTMVKLYFNPQTVTQTSPKPLVELHLEKFKFDTGRFVFRLGEEGQTGSDPFKGIIDDVRFSKVARTTFDTLAP